MASIVTAEANDGQQENEKDQILVTPLLVVTIIIAFFTLRALARMCRATGAGIRQGDAVRAQERRCRECLS